MIELLSGVEVSRPSQESIVDPCREEIELFEAIEIDRIEKESHRTPVLFAT